MVQAYTAESMSSLLREFEADALLDMLFLKHIEHVEVRHIKTLMLRVIE